MPELEARVNQIERDYVGLEQRAVAMAAQITVFSSLPVQVVRLEDALQALRESLADVRREVADNRKLSEARVKEQSEERRALRLALIGLTGVIFTAVIGGVFLLIGGH